MESKSPPPGTHRHGIDLAVVATAFRRFKDTPAGYLEACDRRFAVKACRLRVRVLDRLAVAGIAPVKEGD